MLQALLRTQRISNENHVVPILGLVAKRIANQLQASQLFPPGEAVLNLVTRRTGGREGRGRLYEFQLDRTHAVSIGYDIHEYV